MFSSFPKEGMKGGILKVALIVREGGRKEGRIQKVSLKWLKSGYIVVKHLYFGKFSLDLWCHNFRDVTTLGKFGAWQTNFKITIGRTVFRKSCSTSRFCGGRCLFFSKNHAQKPPIKNKKKCRFTKKSSKVNQNEEQASELASLGNTRTYTRDFLNFG